MPALAKIDLRQFRSLNYDKYEMEGAEMTFGRRTTVGQRESHGLARPTTSHPKSQLSSLILSANALDGGPPLLSNGTLSYALLTEIEDPDHLNHRDKAFDCPSHPNLTHVYHVCDYTRGLIKGTIRYDKMDR